MRSNTVAFTPVTITAETLTRITKEKKCGDLLALYMACVEITTWQGGNSIKATRSFMMKRLSWGEDRLSYAKQKLIEMDLLEPRTRKNSDGTVAGHYLLVKHVIQNNQNPALDSEGTSTNELNRSTNEVKTIKVGLTKQKNDLLALVNKTLNREFRVLPERGVKKTLDNFSLVEIELALTALARDDWHRERLKELKLDYFIRSTTIDKFLAIAKKKQIRPATQQPTTPTKTVAERRAENASRKWGDEDASK